MTNDKQARDKRSGRNLIHTETLKREFCVRLGKLIIEVSLIFSHPLNISKFRAWKLHLDVCLPEVSHLLISGDLPPTTTTPPPTPADCSVERMRWLTLVYKSRIHVPFKQSGEIKSRSYWSFELKVLWPWEKKLFTRQLLYAILTDPERGSVVAKSNLEHLLLSA